MQAPAASSPEPNPSNPQNLGNSASEAMASYAPPSTSQPRPAQRTSESSQLASALQQQGVFQGMNPQDPSTQAHVLHILHQISNSQNAGWQPATQSSSGLESLLSQIARQPELAANLPTLLNSFAGGQRGLDSADAQATYTSQLYGNSGSQLQDAELKDDGDMGMDDDPKSSSVKCAKEKNRQAQRRFRERQKGLITNLKERADTLQKTVDEQRRQIETLEKENNIMRVLIQEKGKQ